jgi:hypothetical protein
VKFSTDGGDTWTCINLGECIYSIAGTAIEDALNNGTIQKGTGQQGPQPAAPAQECNTYHVRLQGREKWHCPSPIASRYTVTVTNPSGGWYDGNVLHAWNCPTGQEYILGACAEHITAEAGDPLQTAYHMQLVGVYGSTYFDPLTGAFEVPGGVSNTDFYIQANDGDLSDNMGEVTFDVSVCTPSPFAWCYEWDFTVSDGGWASLDGYGAYYAGEGWGPGGLNTRTCDIGKSFASVELDQLEIHYRVDSGDLCSSSALYLGRDTPSAGNATILVSPLSLGEHHTATADNLASTHPDLWIWSNTCGGTTGVFRILKVIVRSKTGSNPFGSDNCV